MYDRKISKSACLNVAPEWIGNLNKRKEGIPAVNCAAVSDKTMRRLSAIVIVVLSLFMLGSCAKEGETAVSYEIWSPLGTEKIYRDVAYAEKNGNGLDISMAKNEYESDQLIITCTSGKIRDYDLTVFDLTNSTGGRIAKENISVFMQHYINVTKKNNFNNDYPTGYTPDALIPLELACAKGENTVGKGRNQGLYITVKTDVDTPAGTYTGTFELTVNGKKEAVPVRVTVWDFAVPTQVNTMSCFMLNRNDIMNGELNNTEEMYRAYYETMLKYRLSPMYVPKADRNLEGFLEGLKEYYDVDGFSAYGIPHASDGKDVIYSEMKKTLKAIVMAGDSEHVYLEKGYYYIYDLIDEPHLSADGAEKARHIIARLDETEEEVISELTAEGYFSGKTAEFAERIRSSVRNIPNVVTTSYTESFADRPLTWCPTADEFNSAEKRELYAAEQQRKGSLWWYTCAAPNYPHPSYHIDDNLLGARLLSWMQRDYHVDGNLYWATTTYNKIELNQHREDNITRPIDPYEDPQRMSERWIANGDGYLFYPGKKYGADYPFASIRLEAIRDGLEEYEYLKLLEDIYFDASVKYGMQISVDSLLNSLYDRLFTGTVYSQNHKNFAEMRAELAAEIEAAKNNPADFYITRIEKELDEANVEFVAAAGYSVKVNGTELVGTAQGEGKIYRTAVSLDQDVNRVNIQLMKGGETLSYSKFISSKVTTVALFENVGELDFFTATSTVTLTQSQEQVKSGFAMKVTAESKDTLGYYPAFGLKTSAIGKLTEVDALEAAVFNANDTDLALTVVLVSDMAERKVLTVTLKAGAWNTVSIGKLYLTDFSQLDKTVSVEFRLENYRTIGELMPVQTLYVDNVCFSKAIKE